MWVRHINNKQLYTEVMVALGGGERCWFNEEETRQLEAHNADYSVRRGVWDLLNRYFTVCDIPNDTEERIDTLWPATEVYDFFYDLSPMSMAGIERSGFCSLSKTSGSTAGAGEESEVVWWEERNEGFLYGVTCLSALAPLCQYETIFSYDGLPTRHNPSKLGYALTALCHCHPKYELFSPYKVIGFVALI